MGHSLQLMNRPGCGDGDDSYLKVLVARQRHRQAWEWSDRSEKLGEIKGNLVRISALPRSDERHVPCSKTVREITAAVLAK